jgi:formate-dependent nitrite reductase membrane component NrfD
MVVVMVFLPTRTQQNIPLPPTALKALLALTSLLYILPALWGIASGVGLIRLKNWARISTIVFSVILILIGAFSGLVMPSMQQRPELHFDLIPFMYLGACCGAIMIAIAIYFLVTRKVEFERAAAAALERR